VGTFIERLIGSQLTPTGFVTEAYLMLDMSRHWNSYYKWLEKGRWSWLALARQFVRLIQTVIQEAWQQTRQTLHRWVHITMAGYGRVQLLSDLNSETVTALCIPSPWRRDNPTTAGQIRKGLVMIFRHVRVRDGWDRKCKKFEPPNGRESGDVEQNRLNST